MCGIRQIVAMLATVLALTAGAARAENVVRSASTAESLRFDPHSANHQSTWAQNAQVYEPLVDYNAQNEIQLALAVAWKVADSRSWEFVLRDGVRFHDGTPLGPADVVFSLQRSKAECSDFKSDLPPISEVRAVDERTVRITTEAFDPLLPNRLSQIFIMPRGWAERHGALAPAPYDDAEANFVERHANGSGPFILERFEPGVATVMRRNADWWGLTQYPHNIDESFTRRSSSPSAASPPCSWRDRPPAGCAAGQPRADRRLARPGGQAGDRVPHDLLRLDQ